MYPCGPDVPEISPAITNAAAQWQQWKQVTPPPLRADIMFALECGQRALLASSGYAGRQP